MMYEHGKSDSFVVPVKLLNKAAQSVAEAVEGRRLVKGNLLERSTSRTQRRGIVSQALEWVRQTAKCLAPTRYYLRQEPSALVAPAGIRAGGGQRWPSLPRPRNANRAPASVDFQ